ncbi:MAG: hypothetical protein KUG77_19750 [Nannocystaceae bacterium]|nr:hypothetical protein [Nannocystaceae bacterium]
MSDQGSDAASQGDAGFSAFLQAVAAAPPPEREFASGEEVVPGYRVSRALFGSPRGTKVYLAAGASGDVALLRQVSVTALEQHLVLLARWSKLRGPGRVEMVSAASAGEDVVVVCRPVPAGVLRSWLDAGPHAWPEVCARLGPLAVSLAEAHAAQVYGFSFDADALWLGMDGRALLTVPEPVGSPAQDRENLRALALAALGATGSLPARVRRDRPHDLSPTQTLARGFRLRRRRVGVWVGVGVAALLASALHEPASDVYDDVGLHQAPSVGDRWTRAASRVDAGDGDLAVLVDAVEKQGGAGPRVRARAALLRVRLAEDTAARQIAVRRAVGAAAHTQDPVVRFALALVLADEALQRGALLEAKVHLSRAGRWTGRVQDAARRPLQRLSWAVANAARVSPVRAREVIQASQRISPPSLDRVGLRILLAEVWAAQDNPGMARSELTTITGTPRAQLPRLQLELSVALAHLAMQRGRLDHASRVLESAGVHATVAAERASLWLARASLARLRGDRASAMPAIHEADGELRTLNGQLLHVDLQFERALWSLHMGDADGALDRLDAALSLHDALRGLGARSRVPLERAFRRALQGDTALMSEAPPSRASASP